MRVLILDGYSNHDWRLTTALIRGILEPTGLFAVTCPPRRRPRTRRAGTPGGPSSPTTTSSSRPATISEAARLAARGAGGFEAFVRNGGGVYVWHGGNNAFPDWPAYNEMIGLGWRNKDFGWAIAVSDNGELNRIPAGEGLDTGHGNRLDTVVKRLATTRSTPACRGNGSRPTSRSTTTPAARRRHSRCSRMASTATRCAGRSSGRRPTAGAGSIRRPSATSGRATHSLRACAAPACRPSWSARCSGWPAARSPGRSQRIFPPLIGSRSGREIALPGGP